MKKPEIPKNEDKRLKELRSFHILDCLEQEEYDFLTEMAAVICQVPISLISLVDENRQWFLSHHGLVVRETERAYSFCAHAINDADQILIVPNAKEDERFSDNPLVTESPNISFYAGVPLVTSNGFALGTLCVIDSQPKELTQQQIDQLQKLSVQVVKLLELKKTTKDLTLLKTFVDNSSEGLQIAKASGEIVFVNKVANERLGLREDELGMYKVSDFEEIFKDPGSWEKHVDEIRESGIVLAEGVNTNLSSNEVHNVEVISKIIEVEGEEYLLANSRDITKRKGILRELETTKRILESTNELAKIGGYEFDEFGEKISWTKNMNAIFEVEEDFQFSIDSIVSFYKNDFYKNQLYQCIDFLLTNRESFKEEFLITTPKGNDRWIRLQGMPIIKKEQVTGIFGTVQDIHERKLENLELKVTKDRLESILYEMDDVMWSVDISRNNLLFVSPSAENLLGYTINEWKKDILLWKQVIYPEDRWVISAIREQLLKLQPTNYTFRAITKNGELKWLESRTKFIKEENGIIRVDGFVVDKTRERELEFKLKDEMNLQNLLISIASKYININPLDFDFYVDDSLRKIGQFVKSDRAYVFDYDIRKEIAINTFEWCRKGISSQIENLKAVPFSYCSEQLDAHFKGSVYVVEDVAKLENPKAKEFFESQEIKSFITIPLIIDGKLKGFIGFDFVESYHKFTQQEQNILFLFAQVLINARQKRTQFISLLEKEERYRNIISNMQLGILEINVKGDVTFVNKGFSEMSGYKSKELLGKDPVPIFLDASDLEKINAFKSQQFNSFEGQNFEFEVLDKNQNKRIWYVSITPNFNDNRELIGVISVVLDLTETKRLTKELAKAKDKAETAAKAKEAFLANMSHEIRTPLNVVIGMIRQLSKENLSVEQRFYVTESENASKHLLEILNNILDMSKIESGKLEIESGLLRLPKLIDQIENMFSSQVAESNLEILKYVDENLRPVYLGDETRLKQVILNLVSNAIKFTNEGYITIQAKVIKEYKDRHLIEFRISDTGVGISEEFIEMMFDKFTQENDKSNRRYQGTGLGLAISRDLIDLMGGEIKVESKKNKGTVFLFSLEFPFAEELEIMANPSEGILHEFKGQTILLVEDNNMNRMIVRQTLKNSKVTLLEAKSGVEALEVLKTEAEKIDLILMDIQMPELDGVETTKIIRNELQLKTPIIAITANVFKQDIDFYLSIGMNSYITKPFEEEEFFLKLNLYLIETKTGNLTSKQSVTSAELDLPQSNLFNFSFLEKESDGDLDFIKDMTNIFLDLANETIEGFTKNLEGELNRDEVEKIAHKIKPNLEVMGVDVMFDLIRQINYNKERVETDEELIHLMNEAILILEDVVEELNTINW